MKTGTARSNRMIALVTAVMMAVISAFSLAGCSFFDSLFNTYIEFTRERIELVEGESFDLATVISSSSDGYILTSSNAATASVRGTTLTAHKKGRTTVTAELGDATAQLSVTVSSQNALTLSASGELIQSVGAISGVVFTPEATGDVSNGNITWSVNGERASTLAAGESFTFTPDGAGEFVVTAAAGGLSASETVRVYYPVAASCSYSGELVQTAKPYSAITFTVNIADEPRNPAPVVQWLVGGETVDTGSELTFSYMPTPGEYDISVRVNGEQRSINGASSVHVVCYGSIVPKAPTLEFDNLYPHIYVRYDVVGGACVEISGGGTTLECSSTDGRYASRFGEGVFDAQGLIDLCASGIAKKTYRLRVRSLGDGGAISESEFSEYYSFVQLPSAAREYISTVHMNMDMYITSDTEYASALEYYGIFRDKTAAKPKVSFKCYIAFPVKGRPSDFATDLWNNAFSVSLTSGNYTGIKVNIDSDNVMTTSFTVDTVNSPSRQAYSAATSRSYAKQLHALLPHLNYDSAKYRPDSHVFPIDRLERTESAAYSDELYLVAQNGARPVPKPDSTAEKVYDMARTVLRKIITDDMTDVQKVHAIYDWILWRVTYDSRAAEITANGESYSAYYLEGVFGDGTTQIGGYTYSPYAVCDGLSKAFSLMCNIEGIPCVRVNGKAGSTQSSLGWHAWNKVFVNGGWYLVDCTWGDTQSKLTIDGRMNTYELGYHAFLLLTAEQSDSTHLEPHMFDGASIVHAPTTSDVPLSIYDEMEYNGRQINCRVAKTEDRTKRVTEIVKSFASSYTKSTYIDVPDYAGSVRYEIGYRALDIYFDGGIGMSDAALKATVSAAVTSVLPRADIKTYIVDNVAIVMIK